VVNGAQVLYKSQFGIDGNDPRSTWLLGLLNSAPYLCCAIAGCWLTIPFNHWFGRRGTIFITCVISSLACIWQGFVNTWWHMFVARFVLGFGIGPKSATVPIYAAETSPPAIRGALVMQWQMWTAFGIMFGYAADLAFFQVPDPPHICGFNWRLMMGSACIPAILVCLLVFVCPESPRWYMSKGRYDKAYQTMCRLRYTKLQAARDVYYIYTLLEAETSMRLGQNKVLEMITVPRNRRALLASEIVMFLQQVPSPPYPPSLFDFDLSALT
jgi:MFS family permease